jgi:hypothetical protein
MPGDPKVCREHAATCRRLAEGTYSPKTREYFLNLAVQWERLSAELESSLVFLAATAAMEIKSPSDPSTGEGK